MLMLVAVAKIPGQGGEQWEGKLGHNVTTTVSKSHNVEFTPGCESSYE